MAISLSIEDDPFFLQVLSDDESESDEELEDDDRYYLYYGLRIADLPVDVIIRIFRFCDIQSKGRLARTCKYFKSIIDSEDTRVWGRSSFYALGSNMVAPAMQNRSRPFLSHKDRCKLSKVWPRQLGLPFEIEKYCKCYPWMFLEADYLFISKGRVMSRYKRDRNGDLIKDRTVLNYRSRTYLHKFVVNGDELICSGGNGRIICMNKHDLTTINSFPAHDNVVRTVDAKGNLIVSGSEDFFVKMWTKNSDEFKCENSIKFECKILTTSIMPSKDLFVVGTSKANAPLQLFDLNSGCHIANFGSTAQRNAAIYDTYQDEPNTFLSSSYDSTVKLWDIRCPANSVKTWVETFGMPVHCVRSDHHMTIVVASAVHGCYMMWDKRSKKEPGCTYATPSWSRGANDHRNNYTSFAYSIAYDASHLFVTHDKALLQYSLVDTLTPTLDWEKFLSRCFYVK